MILTLNEEQNGLKPSNYYLPAIHIGTTKSILIEDEMAWFVEIRINKKVIFRESWLIQKSQNLEIIEENLIKKILLNVFKSGVVLNKKRLEDFGL